MTFAIIEWNGLDLFTEKRREGGTVANKEIDAVTVVAGAGDAPWLDLVEKMAVDRYGVVGIGAKKVSERKQDASSEERNQQDCGADGGEPPWR